MGQLNSNVTPVRLKNVIAISPDVCNRAALYAWAGGKQNGYVTFSLNGLHRLQRQGTDCQPWPTPRSDLSDMRFSTRR
jgi:hypothetical protein